MKNIWDYQQGYGGVEAFLVGVVIAAIIYVLYPVYKLDSLDEAGVGQCYIENPNPKSNIEFAGHTYTPLRLKTAVLTQEIQTHLTPVGEVNDTKGVPHAAYTTWLDAIKEEAKKGIYPATAGVEDLLFLDGESPGVYDPPGHSILDIYRREDRDIPSFIIDFCDTYPKMESLTLWQDVSKHSFPPRFFNTNDLQDLHAATERDCPPDICFPTANTKYYLVSYEPFRGRINLNVPGWWTSAVLPITVDSTTVKFLLNYAYFTPIKLIALFDFRDHDHPMQYNYIPEDLAIPRPYEPPDVDTNFGSNWNDKTEQLRAFVPIQVPPWGWWTPECKPAINLYPEKETLVNVKVAIPQGFLTYTDPLYPTNGWTVFAKPNGQLRYLGNNFSDSRGKINYTNGIFPYLYYEGKMADSAVTKPEEGFVSSYEDLDSFFDSMLPQLGLNSNESKEFKDYWLKALPKASYYFIGVIPQEQLNANEPLTIKPKEDTMIRVRLYFEALDQMQSVKEPELQRPIRNGFTVVDWGGMVKIDKAHPFTCLQ